MSGDLLTTYSREIEGESRRKTAKSRALLDEAAKFVSGGVTRENAVPRKVLNQIVPFRKDHAVTAVRIRAAVAGADGVPDGHGP